jgi:hypothetical protein
MTTSTATSTATRRRALILARVVALLLPSLGVARAEEARPCPERMTHLAVLIGVGAYPDVSTVAAMAGVPEARNASWKPLNASRDIDALGAALRRYGFRSGSATHSTWRLLDEAATAGGIRGVLSELSACTSRRGAAAGGALRAPLHGAQPAGHAAHPRRAPPCDRPAWARRRGRRPDDVTTRARGRSRARGMKNVSFRAPFTV